MGIFARSTNASKNTKLAGIRANTSVLGGAVPIIFGQARVSGQLLWYGNFQTFIQPTTGSGGGKGIGSNAAPTYNYTAAVILLLCQGPCAGIASIWASNGNLSVASTSETFTIPSMGGTYTVQNVAGYSNDSGTGVGVSYSQTVNDFGSPGPTTLAGNYTTPLELVTGTPGPNQYSQTGGTYAFNAANAGQVATISYTYNLQYLDAQEIYGIPSSSPWQITVEQADYFNRNVSAAYYPSGTPLTEVGSSPASNEYSVNSSGVYTFNSANAGEAIVISYFYQDPNYNLLPTTNLNLTFFAGNIGQAPWGYLVSSFPGNVLGYTECCYVASPEMNLGSSGEVPNYNFEVVSTVQFGSGIVDANPATCILQLLTNPLYGAGFPAGNCDNWFSAQTSAFYWWAANSFFISPVISQQNTAAQIIQSWCDAGQVGPFFSEGLLKLAPYGDTSIAGNGYIYTAPTAPVVDLDDDDFITDGPEEPIQVACVDPQDIYTQTRIEYYPREGNYNADVLTEDDPAAVLKYGFRPEAPQSYDFICILPAAQFAANMRVRRNVYILNTYTFKLSWKYRYLEPMDLVTISDSLLGYSYLPVRITKREDSADNSEMTITAEDYPWGTQTATLYPKQFPPTGYQPVSGQVDPGQTSALIFEGTNRSQLQKGDVLYIVASSEDTNWGGCNVHVSTDGEASYSQIGPIKSPALVGILQTPMAVSGAGGPWAGGGGTNGLLLNDCDIPNATNYFFPVSTGYNVSGWSIAGGVNHVVSLTATVDGSATGVSAVTYGFPRPDVAAAYPGQVGSPDLGWNLQLNTSLFSVTSSHLLAVVSTDSAGNQCTASALFYVAPNINVIMDSQAFDLAAVTSGNPNNNIAALVNSAGDVELIQWDTVSLIGPGLYTLMAVARGVLGSQILAHTVGEDFAVIAPSTIRYQYDPAFIGTTIYFKFPAYNQFGNRLQGLSQVPAIPYLITGSARGAIATDTGIFQTGFGSAAVAYNPGFSYTATATSITWFWNITVYQTNVALSTVTFVGSQAISGLSASTTYNFYPYVDWSVPGGKVTMVTLGGIGTPAWAHTGDQLQWSQAQSQANHNPLSDGAMTASTLSSGTGGGGGGGTGGGGAGSVTGAMWITGGPSAYTLNWSTSGAGSDTINAQVTYSLSGTQSVNTLGSGTSGSIGVTSYLVSPYYYDVSFQLIDATQGITLAGAS